MEKNTKKIEKMEKKYKMAVLGKLFSSSGVHIAP